MAKICMLVDSLGSGGAQRQFVHLAVGLKRAGHEVVVLHYHPHDFFRDKLAEAGVAVRLVAVSGVFARILRFRLEIRREKPDTVISFLDTPNLLACLAKLSRAGRFRLIVSERNTDVGPLPLRRRLVLFLFRFADLVVANSRTQTESLVRRPALKNKARWIPNCVDLNRFRLTEFKTPGIPIRVLCVGRVVNQKNPDIIVKWLTFHKSNEFVFDWYGNMHLDEMPTIKAGNVCLRIKNVLTEIKSDKLRFFSPKKNIEDIYGEYDLFCLPSLYEGTPNVICEAMASGLPIICSDVCDNSYIVNDGKSGFLFNPDDVESFAAALRRYKNLSMTEIQEMRLFNRRISEELFSEYAYMAAWSEII